MRWNIHEATLNTHFDPNKQIGQTEEISPLSPESKIRTVVFFYEIWVVKLPRIKCESGKGDCNCVQITTDGYC